jgi:hypothetical protein
VGKRRRVCAQRRKASYRPRLALSLSQHATTFTRQAETIYRSGGKIEYEKTVNIFSGPLETKDITKAYEVFYRSTGKKWYARTAQT